MWVRGLTRPWKTAVVATIEVGACVWTSGAPPPAVAGAVPTTAALTARRAAKMQWRGRAFIVSAPAARQVAVARMDDDGALAAQVADRDAALADARQRS